jgi:DnaJ-class molecular chaperone
MQPKNYYSLLGVNYDANALEIKTAFRDLAKKYHPDKNIGNKDAEDNFKEIHEAYSVLSNLSKRKKYDTGLGYKNMYSKTYSSVKPKQFSEEKKEEIKPDKSEQYYFLICIVVASILLYFIVNYK